MESRRWDVLVNIINSNDIETFVEVGTAQGKNMSRILKHTDVPKIWSIDPYEFYEGYEEDNDANAGKERIKSNYAKASKTVLADERVTHLRQKSAEAAPSFSEKSIDLIFIDANHEYEYVLEDLQLWWPKVVEGGFMVMHDYTWRKKLDPNKTNGVIQAVDEFGEEIEDQIAEEWSDRNRTLVFKKAVR